MAWSPEHWGENVFQVSFNLTHGATKVARQSFPIS